MNSRPPWSRLLCTQPERRTSVPASAARKAPQVWVRVGVHTRAGAGMAGARGERKARGSAPVAWRSRLIAMCRTMAMLAGALSFRRRARSSWNTTSSTQCKRFSMCQWVRTTRASCFALSCVEHRKYRVSVSILSPRSVVLSILASIPTPGKAGLSRVPLRVKNAGRSVHTLTWRVSVRPCARSLVWKVCRVAAVACSKTLLAAANMAGQLAFKLNT
jgi:hypothetical protein